MDLILQKMNKFLFLIFLIFIVFSCNQKENTNNSSSFAESSEIVKPDAQLIYTLNCASCHGPDGKLGLSKAADLSKSILDEKATKKMIENGNSKGMMPYKDLLSEEEIDALVEFLPSLKK